MADEKPPPSPLEAELEAIRNINAILQPLGEAGRASVIGYVFKHLGISFNPSDTRTATEPATTDLKPIMGETLPSHTPNETITDILTLAQQKQPKSVNEMVALVAYYVAHHLPPNDRRDHITGADIKPFFQQARFPLPEAPPSVTLANAKTAGYLNSRQRGEFQLSPVGHNLIVHRLGSEGSVAKRPSVNGRRRSRKPTKAGRKGKA
jgi:hypothetical protein